VTLPDLTIISKLQCNGKSSLQALDNSLRSSLSLLETRTASLELNLGSFEFISNQLCDLLSNF